MKKILYVFVALVISVFCFSACTPKTPPKEYVDLNGKPSDDIAFNVNGSVCAIEGITSPDGRIFGKMGHSERKGDNLYTNVPFEKDQKIFESGVAYFK